jgi:hypothetical protein
MSEEYLIEEEEGGGFTGNRTFTLLAGTATAILLLGLICIAAILLIRQGDDNGLAEEIAMRETENAVIAVTNTAVALTIEARETEAALPTETPTSTPEPSPTNTPEPTNTPVVLPVDDEEEEDEIEATPDSLATAIAEAGEEDDVTPIPTATTAPGTTVDTLPDTGFNALGIIVAAFMLLGLTVVARRLRSS